MTTSKKGGQGFVSVGTLLCSQEGQMSAPEATVAVKKLAWEVDDSKVTLKLLKAFVYEIRLIATLCHPNILPLLGFVEDVHDGAAWLVLPWQENGNVREFLQSGDCEIPERIALLQDVARGVVSWRFEVVSSQCSAVITDFGSARIRARAERRHQQPEALSQPHDDGPVERKAEDLVATLRAEFNASTREFTLTGPKFSLRWAAPEVLDDGEQDLPSDIWALGWISWEIVTGRIPFEELSLQGAIISHTIEGKFPPIREDSQLLHVLKLCSMMSDCCEMDPARRIESTMFRRKAEFLPSTKPSKRESGDWKARSARLLLQLGKMHSLQDDNVNAELRYRDALEIATCTKDEPAQAHALLLIGDVCHILSRDGEADKAFAEAHSIYARIGHDVGALNALAGLRKVYHLQSKISEVENTMIGVLAYQSSVGNDRGAADALDELGEIYHFQSRNSEAEKAFLTSTALQSRIGNDLGAANAQVKLGEAYSSHSRYPEAEKAFLDGYTLHSRIGNALGTANSLLGLGKVQSSHSRNREAESAFLEAQAIYSRIGNDLGVANTFRGLGEMYRSQSRYLEAEKAFLEARVIHSRTNDDLGTASTLVHLGETYRLQLRQSEAENAFFEAHAIHSRIAHDLGAANSLVGLGSVYCSQSKYAEAERTLLEAHAIHSRIGNDLGVAHALKGLGTTYQRQSRNKEAEQASREAQAIYSRIGEDIGAANVLERLGQMYRSQSKNSEAEKALLEAYAIHSRVCHEPGAANALLGLGNIYRGQSRTAEAEETLLKAHKIYTSIGDHVDAGSTLGSLAALLHQQGRHPEAVTWSWAAIDAFESNDHHKHKAYTLVELSKIYLDYGQYCEAENAVNEALAVFMSIGDDNGLRMASALSTVIPAPQPTSSSDHESGMDSTPQTVESLPQRDAVADDADAPCAWEDSYDMQAQTEAEEHWHLVQAISLSVGDTQGEAAALLSLGKLHSRKNQHGLAEEHYAHARAKFFLAADNEGEAQALEGLMGVAVVQRKLDQLRQYCIDSCAIYTRTGKPLSKMCMMTRDLLLELESRAKIPPNNTGLTSDPV